MRVAIFAACVACSVPLALAAEGTKPRYIGSWRVETFQDKFTDDTNSAVATISDGHILAFRCLEKSYSIVYGGVAGTKENDKFDILARVDKNSVIDLAGVAIDGQGLIQLEPLIPISQIIAGKEVSLRVKNESGNSMDVSYELSKSKEAFVDFLKGCSLNSGQPPVMTSTPPAPSPVPVQQ